MATLATPFQGSFESIVKITMGTGNLGTSQPSHRERKAARVTPALYGLLPGVSDWLGKDLYGLSRRQ